MAAAALAGLIGCATAPAPIPQAAAAARPEDDVVAIKERVTRLERRLADVDAKLGLLLAQRTPRSSTPDGRAAGPSSITHGVQDLGPRDLIVDEPREEASLGARTVDIGTRRSIYEDASPVEPSIDAVTEDDGSEPVVIRVHGTAPEARMDGSVGGGGSGGLDVGPPAGTSVDEAYNWAQLRIKEGRHLEAIAALEDILARNGAHDLADNAMYWIGWAHQARGDHKLAVEVWQRLPMRFPKSPKIPDALFGMAVSHEALAEPAVAETLFEQLITQYPRAERVKEAKKALARLRPR